MAELHDIITKEERRPCFVKGKKGVWHKWIEHGVKFSAYSLRTCFALVEYEDGTVKREDVEDVKFADGGEFQEFAWIEK